MLVGLLVVKLYLPWCHSLKEKRSEIKSMTDRITKKFSVSVAESGMQDIHQSAEISIAFLASSQVRGDSIMDNMLNYIEETFESEVVSIEREFR